mgnify:CR=1 FL=1
MSEKNETIEMVGVSRGSVLESVHNGIAVICDHTGEILYSWGCPNKTIYPRSSCKMLQALPLIETGLYEKLNLDSRHLAIACSSHSASKIHTNLIGTWLNSMELSEADLRCGPQPISRISILADPALKDVKASQIHNNCSGKHTGFLAVSKYLHYDPEYLEIDHPVQKNVKMAFEEMTDAISLNYGVDGCSAPNFSCTLKSLATGMAKLASPESLNGVRFKAAELIVNAMKLHPILVAGNRRACTDLMLASEKSLVVKTGAEGVFVAIIPDLKIGIALKIMDGATRAAECAISAILVRLGLINPKHKAVQKYLAPKVINWNGLETGSILPLESLWKNGKPIVL